MLLVVCRRVLCEELGKLRMRRWRWHRRRRPLRERRQCGSGDVGDINAGAGRRRPRGQDGHGGHGRWALSQCRAVLLVIAASLAARLAGSVFLAGVARSRANLAVLLPAAVRGHLGICTRRAICFPAQLRIDAFIDFA